MTTQANGYILDLDFGDGEGQISVTADQTKALTAFGNMIEQFREHASEMTFRLFATEFTDPADKDAMGQEAVGIATANYQTNKALMVAAYVQYEHHVIIDVNTYLGPHITY
ncbi:hypothetical protein SEA_PUREGLOBE5_115 [Arthrobacter phage Pureglobe5]|nr:hypothetical protein SEA_PUREGLOBE5_115 [Arthrobacter phage Pureglobe5]